MVSALRTGSVDLTVFDNPVTAKTAGTGKVESTPVGSLSYHVLQLRAASPVLSDVNTRLAIQCAVSRQDVIDSAALGAGELTGPITSPQYRSDPAAQPCPTQDLAKAKQYLAAAGKPDGFDLKLMTSQGLYSTAVNEAQAIQAQLGKVGISVTAGEPRLQRLRRPLAGRRLRRGHRAQRRQRRPEHDVRPVLHEQGSFNKVAGYSSPALDALFARASRRRDAAERTPGLRRRLGRARRPGRLGVALHARRSSSCTTPR